MTKIQQGKIGNNRGKTRKPKKAMVTEAETFPRKSLPCESGPSDDEKGRAFAKLITSPEVAACRVISMMQPDFLRDEVDVPTLMATLRDQAATVQGGDLAYAEAMLINQASTLQSLFVRLTEQGMGQSRMPHLEGFMRLALRAQSQCRATLETLSAIKNPPVVYARQANVTTGPQQINNGTMPPSRAWENEIQQTQLSGRDNELLQDTRASQVESRTDQTLEALGKIDGAKVPRR